MNAVVRGGSRSAAFDLREPQPCDPVARISLHRVAIRAQRGRAIPEPGGRVSEQDVRFVRPHEQRLRDSAMVARVTPVLATRGVAPCKQRLVADQAPNSYDAQGAGQPSKRESTPRKQAAPPPTLC